MAHKAAVVIPTHKETINEFEKISLAQVQKVLKNYPIIFAVPEGKIFSWMPENSQVIKFPAENFASIKAYDIMMTSPQFYEKFLDYEYILIYHLDAFVFSDELEYFCSLGYDNISAPWTLKNVPKFSYNGIIHRPRVGNGGFCLRKVKTHCDFLTKHAERIKQWQNFPDDTIFAFAGVEFKDEFSVAPINVASKFAVEHFIERFIKKNGGKLPFGCHAWHILSGDFALKNFSKFGYDLNPLRAKMGNGSAFEAQYYLMNYAMKRLNRRVQRGQSLMRYLPKKNFASIRVLRNPFALMILVRLILENNKISNEIILYDEDEQDILIQDLKSERTPHLLITAGGGDDALINELSKRGVTYGNRVVSFHKEYMNYCKQLFKKLGK